MTNSTLLTPQICYYHQQRDDCSPWCMLQWRQGQLLVRFYPGVKQLYLPSLGSDEWLVECLKCSSVRLVRLDPALGEEVLKRWVDACKRANKPVFLLGNTFQKLPRNRNQFDWRLKRPSDRTAALLLLMLASPFIIAIIAIVYIYSPGPIFSRQWRVGVRGKLFQAIKFRTQEVRDSSRATPIGSWMSKYGLDKLPYLFNVLRGEMSLTEQRSWTLSEAMHCGWKGQRWLRKSQEESDSVNFPQIG